MFVVGYNTSANVGCSIVLIYNTCILCIYLTKCMYNQFFFSPLPSSSTTVSNKFLRDGGRDGLLRPQWNGKDHTVS